MVKSTSVNDVINILLITYNPIAMLNVKTLLS